MWEHFLAALCVSAILLLVLVVVAASVGLDNYRWYRRACGGHWERWVPGAFTSEWWIQSPTGRCSHQRYHWSGRVRTHCEDWPLGE